MNEQKVIGPVYMGKLKDYHDIRFHFGFDGCDIFNFHDRLAGVDILFAVSEDVASGCPMSNERTNKFFALLQDKLTDQLYTVSTSGDRVAQEDFVFTPADAADLATGIAFGRLPANLPPGAESILGGVLLQVLENEVAKEVAANNTIGNDLSFCGSLQNALSNVNEAVASY